MLLALMLPIAALAALPSDGWFGHPDLHGDSLVFSAGSDLWVASSEGGEARSLTAFDGVESRPRLSPDGAQVAFTATMHGNAEVYVLPLSGGTPRRLTWHPGADRVVGWLPDGSGVTFASGRTDPGGYASLFSVPVQGGEASAIGVGMGDGLALEPGGARVVVSDSDTDWFPWKRYQGGMAPRLRVGVPGSEMVRIAAFSAWSPVWRGDRIWFVSDAEGRAELGSVAPDGGGLRWETAGDSDASAPALAPDGRVVFVRDGRVVILDPETRTERTVPIQLPPTVGPPATPVPLADALDAVLPEPGGDRTAVIARGQLHLVDGEGWWTPAGVEPGVRYGPAAWGGVPGKKPSATRPPTLWTVADDGARGRLLVQGKRGWKTLKGPAGEGWIALAPSPDGAWVAGVHWDGRVLLADTRRGEVAVLAQSPIGDPPTGLAWRPDSGMLVFDLADVRSQRGIWGVAPPTSGSPADAARSGAVQRLTSDRTDDHSPVWSDDGRTLFFIGERDPQVQLDHRDMAFVSKAAGRPMAMPLVEDRSIEGRPRLLQAKAGEWTLEGVVDGHLVGTLDEARWSLSLDAPPVALPELPPRPGLDAETLDDRTLSVDRPAEWVQMVGEACRQSQDLFWDPTLRDLDWPALCDVARARARRVVTRRELELVLEDLIGELSAAHAFVYGGDRSAKPVGAKPGLLGGEFSWAGDAWRVDRVLIPDDTMPMAAPLVDGGVAEGDCIRTVDGVAVGPTTPLSAMVRGEGEAAVILGVVACNDDPGAARPVSVRPLARESDLRASDQVRLRTLDVQGRSAGRIAYVFMPDVVESGLAAFEQGWAGQRDRDGLILDLRRNGGGWYSDTIVDRLTRSSNACFMWRSGDCQTWPIRSPRGPVVVLVDQGTVSEGEILARGLQLAGATVVGVPTWGGLSGDHGGRPLADGGEVRVPGVVWRDPIEGFSIETRGVAPDVLVVDLRLPGVDPWLDAAVAVIHPPAD